MTPDNVANLVARTGLRAVHGSCRLPAMVDDRLMRFGFGGPGAATSRAVVQAMLARLGDLA